MQLLGSCISFDSIRFRFKNKGVERQGEPPGICLVLLFGRLLRIHHFCVLLPHAPLRTKGKAAPAVFIAPLPQHTAVQFLTSAPFWTFF